MCWEWQFKTICMAVSKMATPVLSDSEELTLVNWLKQLAQTVPQKKCDLLDTVQKIVHPIKELNYLGGLCDIWYDGIISEPKVLTKSRALITKESVRKWLFRELQYYILKIGKQDILMTRGEYWMVTRQTRKVLTPKGGCCRLQQMYVCSFSAKSWNN